METPVRPKLATIRALVRLSFLSSSLVMIGGCGEEANPFGGELSGYGGAGGTNEGGLVRGKGGTTGVLNVVTGPDAGAMGSAGADSGVDAGASGNGGTDGKPTNGSGGAGGSPGSVGSGGSAGAMAASGGRVATSGTTGTTGAGGSAAGGTAGRSAASTGGATGVGGNRSGGASGTGGLTGTPATGGASATGGRTASGGTMVSSGGVPGTGGAPSSGGAPGSGGAVSSGGAPGTGGAPATSAECDQFIREYDAEIQSAQVCKDKAKSCDTLVPAKLAGCGSTCTTFVDKINMLDQIEKKWTQAGCVSPSCPGFVCINPVSSICSVVTGMCTDFF